MRGVTNIGNLSDKSIRALLAYLETSVENASVANVRKGQFIFQAEAEGLSLIVKIYQHGTLRHRLASLLNKANADRYVATCLLLAKQGIIVPRPLLLVKSGTGLLPLRTLLAMTRLDGRMLLDALPEIESDPVRIATLAPKIAGLIRGLRRARVIHRDLTTKNILITPDDELGLIDFDFSRQFHGDDAKFARKHQRDLGNFISTCSLSPRLAEAVHAQTTVSR